MLVGEAVNTVCAKCQQPIKDTDLVHWPHGVEEHIDCNNAKGIVVHVG